MTGPDLYGFVDIPLSPGAGGITVDRLTLRAIMLRELMDVMRFDAGFSHNDIRLDIEEYAGLRSLPAGLRRNGQPRRSRGQRRPGVAPDAADGASGWRNIRNEVSSPSSPARIGTSNAACSARCRASVLIRTISAPTAGG